MNETPWLDWMRSHIGESFATGQTPTDFNRMVFSHTDCPLGDQMLAGCAATVCAALELTGFKSTHRADAISYADYGDPCELKYGCIVVIEHQTGNHHVTFCDQQGEIDPSQFQCLGGNQSHSLKDSVYQFGPGGDKVIATRWPVT